MRVKEKNKTWLERGQPLLLMELFTLALKAVGQTPKSHTGATMEAASVHWFECAGRETNSHIKSKSNMPCRRERTWTFYIWRWPLQVNEPPILWLTTFHATGITGNVRCVCVCVSCTPGGPLHRRLLVTFYLTIIPNYSHSITYHRET